MSKMKPKKPKKKQTPEFIELDGKITELPPVGEDMPVNVANEAQVPPPLFTVLVMPPPGFLPITTDFIKVDGIPFDATIKDVMISLWNGGFKLPGAWHLAGYRAGMERSEDLEWDVPATFWSFQIDPTNKLLLVRG